MIRNLALILGFSLSFLSGGAQAAPETEAAEAPPAREIKEGREFRRILPAQPTTAQPGQVEVLEFFWYGCPHCFSAEEHIKAWLANKPDNVVFKRVPATTNRGWVLMARAYYTAEQLDVLDVMHDALFSAFHGERQMLGSEDRLAAYFADKAGVDEAVFRETFNSIEVSSKVQRADLLARRYRVAGVPAMTVNGKFITDPDKARGYKAMIETVDTLARLELQQQGD